MITMQGEVEAEFLRLDVCRKAPACLASNPI